MMATARGLRQTADGGAERAGREHTGGYCRGGLAIPARREHELETDTILAVRIQVILVRKEVAVQGRFRLLGIVETVESNSLLLKSELGHLIAGPLGLGRVWDRPCEVAEERVSGYHPEVGRERLDVLSVQEIVPIIIVRSVSSSTN